MVQIIKRGILASFDPITYTASVLILEATSAVLTNVPISTSFNAQSAVIGDLCAVLFFDENNHVDAVIVAIFPNGSSGIPTTTGQSIFVTAALQINAVLIASAATTTFTIAGSGNIPIGATGIIYRAFFTSPTANAYIYIAPSGGTIANYQQVGLLALANGFMAGNGVVALDASGRIDIKANTGNCTVTLYTQGYLL